MSRHGFSEPFQGFLSIPPSSNPLRKRSIYQHPNVTYEKTRDAERLSGLHRVSEEVSGAGWGGVGGLELEPEALLFFRLASGTCSVGFLY